MHSPYNDNNSYLKGLIAMMEHLSEPWGIKDLNSRHIYMNKAAFLYTNTPVKFDIDGKLDHEFPADWAELAEDLTEHDKRTEKSQDRVSVIETHYWYGKNFLTPFISEKFPVYNNEKQCIWIVWNAKPLNTLSPLQYINQQKPSILTTEIDTKLFTKAEMDIIFFILHRFSNKEIAKIYNVSHKTIENRIYNMYQKADVHSYQQFEEFCRHLQLDNYIPERLIEKGILFI
ncbi:helix-turn-helix transcriptional regulator [Xenorhabdus szentirmaii]|uniref:LuxR-family transcriptional regulator n=2 Tax=Xenorhabdus szentirmaii TaxID=290112 RepID=W1IYK9_9GAMM|nr:MULTISPECIES: helix-turn-helix transcriptional regulator [Xenorhabdus]MBD2781461.1 helix-turn-helix transcriptional regulator [Xenorhabdus sp. 38]MBD2793912.1 helix-turn-helix transcriptional regulator [Xenorhabdus sp. CUL]MBD2802511.1 helix-turn-helix transcriptional regulator [Xenorhabdus sp. M]MBD2804324.1 helix-turn-helix transcriptional regulator [Xenorhabdus sp. ZM]MBD2820896.1 helix-turn-helix transcriptional regulator [Xenorhabdus sp. 42]